jgi:phage tail sheath gpL-like
MGSLLITVKHEMAQSALQQYFKPDSTNPKLAARALQDLFRRIGGGIDQASVDVATASADPVAASGTITCTYASIANNDTVTVAGVTLTCVTGTPTGAQFKKETDAATTATNLAALINANTTTKKYVSASAASGVCTVTAIVKHPIGNLVTLATSNGTGFGLSGANLASGAGGSDETATTFAFGL